MTVSIVPWAERYLELYKKANKARDERAAFQLAEIYITLRPKAYKKKAYDLYKLAAAKGLAEGRYGMGICLENGVGVKQNNAEAAKNYLRAVDCVETDLWKSPQDDAERVLSQAMSDPAFQKYWEEVVAPWEEPRTFEMVNEEASSGDADAQNELGHMYFYGKNGAPHDLALAKFWFRCSAEQGCEAGIKHLADLCYKEMDYKEAAKWYRKYAEIWLDLRRQRLGW